jgi:hypothetical protein
MITTADAAILTVEKLMRVKSGPRSDSVGQTRLGVKGDDGVKMEEHVKRLELLNVNEAVRPEDRVNAEEC